MLKASSSCFYLIIAFFALAVPSVAACEQHEKEWLDPKKLQEMTIKTADGELHFNIDVALTAEQQRNGLMGRTNLPDDYAMLFWFGDDAVRTMWMKGTAEPLDMLFVDRRGKIVYIKQYTTPFSEQKISSKSPVRAVIEVRAGLAEAKGIKKGQTIIHPYFRVK